MDNGQLIIIGAGPAGLACSIAASGAGLDHLVLEKGTIANTIYRFPADMTFFSTPDKLAIGDVPFTCPDNKPTAARRSPTTAASRSTTACRCAPGIP